jgi:3''-phosphoadenosine 5''-phosphosulfate sulfotransferase (PAPS reductase)/FAD synthetase and related enzymes
MNIDWGWVRRWREYFLAWYDEGRVSEKAAEAADFIERYVGEGVLSVSGGKDSMAMLHIAATQLGDAGLDIFHWDHGPALMPRDVETGILESIRSVAPRAKLVVKQYSLGESNRARTDWRPWYREFFSTLRSLGYKYHILGIRRDESSRRAARGRVVERRHWVEIHPIYNFTWRDVWAYIFKHAVPIPRAYLAYAKLLGWERVRLVTFFDRELERYGSPQVDSVLAWRYRNTCCRH